MKSLRTIKQLRSDMFKATNKYHQTIIQNLKELGKDLEVVAEGWDEDEDEPKGCKVTSLGEDNESYEAIIDMIRYEASEPVVKVAIHVAWYNYKEINQWWGLSDLTGEAADYVLDSIQWPDEMNEGEAEDKPIDILERLEAIKQENGDIVSLLIPKAIKNGQTIYGELSDWLRDYHNDLPLKERDMLAKLLLGDMVVQHPDYISRVKPNKVMVLCSYDEDDNDTDVHLVVSKHQFDTDKEGIREAIEGMWDLDLYDEDDLDELRECISDLLKGDNGYFGSEYYWEEKDCVL